MKRKTLTTALLAGLTGTVGIANMSNAVNINSDGLGQTLIYPYYTVRGGTDTLISVVNTTSASKAVKVRFLEGMNSREVLDFNLYLSEFDVWTAAITDDGAAGRIFTNDETCTVPSIGEEGEQFRNFAFTDGGPTDVDRTREGYLEMIEMGELTSTFETAPGKPLPCPTLAAQFNPGGAWAGDPTFGVNPPGGGLFGGASLINVEGGLDAAYNADALADFFAPADAGTGDNLHTDPGSLNPSLNNAEPPISRLFEGGRVFETGFAEGVDAVSAVYMHDAIMNEYILDASTNSGTDWVTTFPTKRFYAGASPFTVPFDGDVACEPVSLDLYDREENTVEGGLDFSPQPPGGENALCWEVTVVTFDNSNVLGSHLVENVSTPPTFEHGWLQINFTDAGHQLTGASTDGTEEHTYHGLPVTGFQVQTFNNGDVGGLLSNYAGLFDHRASRDIDASAL